jgi:hypothetical protein
MPGTEALQQLPRFLREREQVAPWILLVAGAAIALKIAGRELAERIRAFGDLFRGRRRGG